MPEEGTSPPGVAKPLPAFPSIRPTLPRIDQPESLPTADPAKGPRELHRDVHLPALDGIRGLAVLLVIVHHCVAGGAPPRNFTEKACEVLAGRAWVGVDLFFVLSGFLITGILLDTRERAGYFRSFYPRRMLRTFPLYYATLAVCFFVLPWIPAAVFDGVRELSSRQGWFWLHVSNFYTGFHNVLRPDGPDSGWMATFWSLAVEEHFYLVWPLLVFWLRPRALAWACGALLATTLGVRMALAARGFGFEFIYYSTFSRLDGLVLGSLVAVFSRQKGGLSRFVGPARALAVASAVTLAALSLADGGRFSFFGRTFLFSLVAACFASLLVLVIEAPARSRLKGFFTSRVLRSCGKYSYAMYILNIPLIGLLKLFFVPEEHRVAGSTVPVRILLMVAASLVTWAAAQVTWHSLEKHCLKLKRYFEAGSPRPRLPEPAGLAPR